jgi:hypothetical protein
MQPSVVTVTRKIQLLVSSIDKEVQHNTWQTLYNWRYACFRAANYILGHHYLMDRIKDMHYLTEEVSVKLSNIHKDEDGILTTSKANTTYQVLSKLFKGSVPMSIMASLNSMLVNIYNSERSSYINGEKTVRNYKRTIPIPFPPVSMTKMTLSECKRFYTFSLFGLPFQTYFGNDKGEKKAMWEKAISGEYKLLGSSIKIEQKKIFMFAVFQFEKNVENVKQEIVAEASLNLEVPIVVNIGKYRFEIGNKEEFLFRRLAIQQARIRCQKGIKYNKGQHGRKRKTQNLEAFRQREKRYVDYKLHLYSRMLIDHCIRHKAGTLILLNQQDKEEQAKEQLFVLRNWSYSGLREKIEYKASRAGITVIIE